MSKSSAPPSSSIDLVFNTPAFYVFCSLTCKDEIASKLSQQKSDTPYLTVNPPNAPSSPSKRALPGPVLLRAFSDLYRVDRSCIIVLLNGQTMKDYLVEPQPRVDLSSGESKDVLIPSVRLAMSAEGCILTKFHVNEVLSFLVLILPALIRIL